MPNKTWKEQERRAAKYWGGVRNPLSGGNSRQTHGDVIHPQVYVEKKTGGPWKLWEKVAALAKKEGKIPVIMFYKKHQRGSLLVIRTTDFDRLLKIRENVIKKEGGQK